MDASERRAAWHARTLEDGSLAEFLERLRRDLGSESAAAAVQFDARDGLSLEEGRLVALVFNPGLRLARLRAGKATASAEYASLWADPELSFDALWITESVSERWVVSPGLAFSIPLSGRLAAERGLADARVRAAEQQVLEAEWTLWHEVQEDWVSWSAAGLRVQETERLIEALDDLVRTTARLAESGELPRTEASLFALEAAQRRNGVRRLRGEVGVAEQRLRAHLGLAPEAPIELLPSIGPSSEAPARGRGDTSAEIAVRNPSLARLREEYEVAEQGLRREIRKQVPDLSLGPLYESDQGQSRVGLLGGLPLPLLNRNRKAIAEARVEREIARATFETEYESLVGRSAAATARARALAEQRVDIEEVLVPLLDRQLEDALRLMQLGEGTSLVLLDSFTRAHETKLELIETRMQEALARAELEYLTGPAASERSRTAKEQNP